MKKHTILTRHVICPQPPRENMVVWSKEIIGSAKRIGSVGEPELQVLFSAPAKLVDQTLLVQINEIVYSILKLKVSAKNEELQVAAKLGQQMLERNDELQEELENLQQSNSNLVEVSSCTRSRSY